MKPRSIAVMLGLLSIPAYFFIKGRVDAHRERAELLNQRISFYENQLFPKCIDDMADALSIEFPDEDLSVKLHTNYKSLGTMAAGLDPDNVVARYIPEGHRELFIRPEDFERIEITESSPHFKGPMSYFHIYNVLSRFYTHNEFFSRIPHSDNVSLANIILSSSLDMEGEPPREFTEYVYLIHRLEDLQTRYRIPIGDNLKLAVRDKESSIKYAFEMGLPPDTREEKDIKEKRDRMMPWLEQYVVSNSLSNGIAEYMAFTTMEDQMQESNGFDEKDIKEARWQIRRRRDEHAILLRMVLYGKDLYGENLSSERRPRIKDPLDFVYYEKTLFQGLPYAVGYWFVREVVGSGIPIQEIMNDMPSFKELLNPLNYLDRMRKQHKDSQPVPIPQMDTVRI